MDSHRAGVANQVLTEMNARAVEKKRDENEWANRMIASGIGAIVLAIIAILVPLLAFRTLFVIPPLVAIVLGLIAVINGIAQRMHNARQR